MTGDRLPRLETSREAERLTLVARGCWTTEALDGREGRLAARDLKGARAARIELAEVERLDTAGVVALLEIGRRLKAAGVEAAFAGLGAERQALFDKLARRPPYMPPEPRGPLFVEFLSHLGEATLAALAIALELLGFLGRTIVAILRATAEPQRIRFIAMLHHMEKTGVDALPIIGLISFLIGVVLAYQGADQLARFGAQVFTVNLVGISVLREMGILLTAIMVAGRSGSAFAAQIGTMRVNQEIDALQTLGLDPMDFLVLPRILALVLVVPLLTFYADIMGLLGGATMVLLTLDMSVAQFLRQLDEALTLEHLFVGLVKAPVFAFIIGLVGCFEGLKVGGNAESVGLHTTRAVVEGIFLVIVLDSLFSIFFSIIGV